MTDEAKFGARIKKTKPSNKMQALTRKIKLWLRFDARHNLIGVSYPAEDGTVYLFLGRKPF
eukprot:6910907-Karenia_brevis.AAC.1